MLHAYNITIYINLLFFFIDLKHCGHYMAISIMGHGLVIWLVETRVYMSLHVYSYVYMFGGEDLSLKTRGVTHLVMSNLGRCLISENVSD